MGYIVRPPLPPTQVGGSLNPLSPASTLALVHVRKQLSRLKSLPLEHLALRLPRLPLEVGAQTAAAHAALLAFTPISALCHPPCTLDGHVRIFNRQVAFYAPRYCRPP